MLTSRCIVVGSPLSEQQAHESMLTCIRVDSLVLTLCTPAHNPTPDFRALDDVPDPYANREEDFKSQKFTCHLDEVKQNYFEHMLDAFGVSAGMALISLKMAVHAVVPDAFSTSATSWARQLISQVNEKKKKIEYKVVPVE